MKHRINYKIKPEKILEAFLYLVHKKPGIDQYTLVKLLYLSDKKHLTKYGRPITFDTYVAMSFGPVGSFAYDLAKQNKSALDKVGIEELPLEAKLVDNRFSVFDQPEREPILKKFSKSDLKILDEVIEEFGDCNFGDLYDLTHKHFAYRNAWDNKDTTSKQAEMAYEDFFEVTADKEEIIEDLETIAPHI